MQTKKSIEKHLSAGEKAYATGNYDIASAELALALTMVDQQSQELKREIEGKGIEDVAERFKQLSELQSLQKKAKFLLDVVEREKIGLKSFRKLSKVFIEEK